MSQNTDTNLPDYLFDIFAASDELGGIPTIEDNDFTGAVRLPSIEIPQRTGMTHAGHLGEMYVSPLEEGEDGEYVPYLDLLLVDPLVITERTLPSDMAVTQELRSSLPTGARILWNSKRDDPTEDPVLCASGNGIAPWKKYLGKELNDTRTTTKHRIGVRFDKDTADYYSVQNACIGCPFAAFDGEDAEHGGKKFPPLCRESHEYVVWSVKHQALFKLKGTNNGVNLALRGVTGKRYSGRMLGNLEIPGIRSFFVETGFIEANGKKIPTFSHAPEGRPTLDNISRPVYPVRMYIGLNSYKPPTFIPLFVPLNGSVNEVLAANQRGADTMDYKIPTEKAPLTIEQYAAYLKAVNEYVNSDMRTQMMGLATIDRTNQRMLADSSQKPSLPPTVVDSDTEDIEGDYSNPYN